MSGSSTSEEIEMTATATYSTRSAAEYREWQERLAQLLVDSDESANLFVAARAVTMMNGAMEQATAQRLGMERY